MFEEQKIQWLGASSPLGHYAAPYSRTFVLGFKMLSADVPQTLRDKAAGFDA